MLVLPNSLDLSFMLPTYRAWIKTGPGRRSSTATLPSKYTGKTLRETRRLHGVGRPPRA
jgi:hypothetical protein